LAGSTAGAEAAELLAESGVVVAEAGSDILLAATIDDDGTEGFVEALRVGGRLEEEAAVRGVVHGGSSECDRGAAPWNVSGERDGRG
jgi:hypothetical protein